jgi:hypothetical protein
MCPDRDTCAQTTFNNYAHLETRRAAEAGQTCHGHITRRCAKQGGGSFAHLRRSRSRVFPTLGCRLYVAECLRHSDEREFRRNSPTWAETNFASPRGVFVTPPGRNSDNFAPPTRTKCEPANNLRGQGGAKFAEFRPTRKKKKIWWGEMHAGRWTIHDQKSNLAAYASRTISGCL